MSKKNETFWDFMGFQTGAISRSLSKYFNKEAAKFGITVGQMMVVLYIEENGVSSLKDIAKGLKLENPATSRQVDILMKEGFVIREENHEDRRYANINLTDKGKVLAKEVVIVPNTFNDAVKEKFGEEEYYKILEYYKKMEEYIAEAL